MTHAGLEMKRFKEAFEKWCRTQGLREGDEVADLFWPFVQYLLNDLSGDVEKTKLFNRFKHALGMELMAHEMVGLELTGTPILDED